MNTQIVQHKSRDFDVVLNFPATENTLSWAFTAENDGEIYAVDSANVASYQIAGAPVTLPYTVTAGSSYSVTIVKQTNGQPAHISFKTRRAVNKSVSISVPDLKPQSEFGTKTFCIHRNEFKISIVSTENVKSYIGNYSFAINPVVEIDIPVIPGTWEDIVYDSINDRMILFGMPPAGTAKKIFICTLNIDTGIVSDIQGVLGAYTELTFIGDNVNMLKCYVNNVSGETIIRLSSFYNYLINNTSLSSLNLIPGMDALFGFSNPIMYPKTGFLFSRELYLGVTALYDQDQLTRFENFNTGIWRTAINNINEYVYCSSDAIGQLSVWHKSKQIKTIGTGGSYRASILIPNSRSGKLLVTGNGSYGTPNHALFASIIDITTDNFFSRTQVFDEINVTGVKSADGIDSEGLFVILSNGTAGSEFGKRTLCFVDSNNSTQPVFAKIKLNYDCDCIASNTINY